jgi:PhzF family phenazine biosynthesis protein
MTSGTIHRLSAFTDDPKGGNPAGVWIGGILPTPQEMQRIAAEIGFSETAFVAPRVGKARTIRYYSPEAEVPFCGHATIATGVVLGDRDGPATDQLSTYHLSTIVGIVPVTVRRQNNIYEASLTSVEPQSKPASDRLLNEALGAIGWTNSDLDSAIPPALAYAGSWHLVLAVNDNHRLQTLSYDFDGLKALMLRENLTTLQLVWRENENCFYSRNPFPVGGVVEDPATGSAAAALGGYLRDSGLMTAPYRFVIHQGEAMGRPSRIVVEVPLRGGIVVTGQAIAI